MVLNITVLLYLYEINAALVSMRLLSKTLNIVPTPNFWIVVYYVRDYIEYLYSTLTTFKVHIVRLTIAKYTK